MADLRTSGWRSYLGVIFLELVVVFVVIGIFKSVSDKLLAARLASLVFFLQGLGICFLLRPWTLKNINFTLPTVILFQLFFVIPMAIFRWFTDESFNQFNFLGISGPTLHEWSSRFYYLLLVSTVIDLIILFYRRLPKRD
jgi:hypothetical protein